MVITIEKMTDLLGYRTAKFVGNKIGYNLYNDDVVKNLLEEMYKVDCYKLTMEVLEFLYTEACKEWEYYENPTLPEICKLDDDPFGVISVPEALKNAV